MSFYLDTSLLVALFVPESLTSRAEAFLEANPGRYIVSNLGAAEFASAISRRVRTGETTTSDARLAFATFDDWCQRSVQWVDVEPADITKAGVFLRRLDLPLLTPDAIHIAVVQRIDGTLVALDRQMTANARALGCRIADP